MPDYANFTIYVGMSPDNRLEFRHELRKEESRHLSDYQDIGLIYLQMTSAIWTNSGLVTLAKDFFMASMRQKGFRDDEIRVLLYAESWEERMLFSWYAVSEQARASSTSIDYDRYQNYWPNLDFCKDGWGADPFVIQILESRYRH